MKKIPTIFMREPGTGPRKITTEPNPECGWFFNAANTIVATVKFDGTCCAVINGELYRRFDAKDGKPAPEGAIPCQPEPDPVTSHWPHWVKCDRNKKADRWHFDAWDNKRLVQPGSDINGTYELCGPKVQGNPENTREHVLIRHGKKKISMERLTRTYSGIKHYLMFQDIEGIVFYGPNGEMAKIKKKDYDMPRSVIRVSASDAVETLSYNLRRRREEPEESYSQNTDSEIRADYSGFNVRQVMPDDPILEAFLFED